MPENEHPLVFASLYHCVYERSDILYVMIKAFHVNFQPIREHPVGEAHSPMVYRVQAEGQWLQIVE